MLKLICDFCGEEITGHKITVTVEPDVITLGTFPEEQHFHTECATRLKNKCSQETMDINEVRHFLEAETLLTRKRLNSEPNEFYDGELVGYRASRRLLEKHISFCENLLKMISK